MTIITVIAGAVAALAGLTYWQNNRIDNKNHLANYYQERDRVRKIAAIVGVPAVIIFIISAAVQMM